MTMARKPEWLKSNKRGSSRTNAITSQLRRYHLHTVCQSAQCPNKGECFERGTATFLLLGNTCTRTCKFCAVNHDDNIQPPDEKESDSIVEMVNELDIRHVVLTTVTRDDLPDGGAAHIANVVQTIRQKCSPETTIEVLISDLQGNREALHIILDAKPDILNHNLETVPRLYMEVRPEADYRRSLAILGETRAYRPEMLTKSGIMVGLGEKEEEVIQLMQDLRQMGCNILTIGQYLPPSRMHYPVAEYVHPTTFQHYRDTGLRFGFTHVESGPLVRSSYHAEEARTYINHL